MDKLEELRCQHASGVVRQTHHRYINFATSVFDTLSGHQKPLERRDILIVRCICFLQVASLNKADEHSGLGISLEGTVDVEDGKEVRPHHYIRSILPEGPVGRHGRLISGDELLEVIYITTYKAKKISNSNMVTVDNTFQLGVVFQLKDGYRKEMFFFFFKRLRDT